MTKRRFSILAGLAWVAVLLASALLRPTAAANSRAQLANVTTTVTETALATLTATDTALPTAEPSATPIPTTEPSATPSSTPVIFTATVPPTPTGTPLIRATRHFWSYSVPFVCGEQPASQANSVPPLALGNYSSAIMIRNPFYRGAVWVYVQPQLTNGGIPAAQPFAVPITLDIGAAALSDCSTLWVMLHPGQAMPQPAPLVVGAAAIVSPRNIDVNSMITVAAPGGAAAPPALSAQTIVGKRVAIPPSAFQDGQYPPDEQFVDDD